MPRSRSILVPVGHDPTPESLLVQAARPAGRVGASNTPVTVVEDLPRYARLVLASTGELEEPGHGDAPSRRSFAAAGPALTRKAETFVSPVIAEGESLPFVPSGR